MDIKISLYRIVVTLIEGNFYRFVGWSVRTVFGLIPSLLVIVDILVETSVRQGSTYFLLRSQTHEKPSNGNSFITSKM